MTSLAELLDDIAPRAWADLLAGTADENDAVRALGQAARLLEGIADAPVGWDRLAATRAQELAALARRCRQLDPGPAPIRPRRLGEVMAAAADLVATMTPPPSPGERWAIACATLDPMRSCTAILRERTSSPAIIDIGIGLDRLQWLCDVGPPAPADGARLDQARPSTSSSTAAGLARIRALIDDVAYRAATTNVSTGDARLFAAAGLNVAIYARPIEIAITGGSSDTRTIAGCDAMVAGWFDVRDAIRDAARRRRPSGNAAVVAELAQELTATFGAPTAPKVTVAPATAAEVATTYRAVVNRLPDLARGIARAADQWGTTPVGSAIDPAQPIPWRDHTGITRYARIKPTEIPKGVCEHVAQVALDAAQASVVVAANADRTAMRIGRQPHAHLARAHAVEASKPAPPTTRWRAMVASIDDRVVADPSWPNAAHVIDRAASHGWDATEQLPGIARDLPDRRPALELAYRVRAHCDLQPATSSGHAATASTDLSRRHPLSTVELRPPPTRAPSR